MILESKFEKFRQDIVPIIDERERVRLFLNERHARDWIKKEGSTIRFYRIVDIDEFVKLKVDRDPVLKEIEDD
jgi:hypothetical protein